jgi:hypothetical protein
MCSMKPIKGIANITPRTTSYSARPSRRCSGNPRARRSKATPTNRVALAPTMFPTLIVGSRHSTGGSASDLANDRPPVRVVQLLSSPSARKNGIAARLVRGVQVVHVVIEFIEAGVDGSHSLPARAQIRSAAPAGHLGHPGPLLVLLRLCDATERSLRTHLGQADGSISWRTTALPRTITPRHRHFARLHAPQRFDGQRGLKLLDQHKKPHTAK